MLPTYAPPPVPPAQAALGDLIWLNTADLLAGFGVAGPGWLRGLAALAARRPARRFAGQLAALDAVVGAAGLAAGGAWICGQYAPGLAVAGPRPPASGPLLVVANHPGLLDAAALFVAIGRADLKVIAVARPLIRALPHIAGAIIPVGATAAARMAALRAAARHMREGGAVLTFPAGRIEPDPAAGGAADLGGWSGSLGLLCRMAAGAAVVPAIVSGVQAPAAQRHPLTRLRRGEADRRWLAAILQVIWPRLADAPVQVRLGAPVAAGPAAQAAVLAAAEGLIRASARR